jgi:hypothetical protein
MMDGATLDYENQEKLVLSERIKDPLILGKTQKSPLVSF